MELNIHEAVRSAYITPDPKRIKLYDPHPVKMYNEKIRFTIYVFTSLVLTCWCIWTKHPFWAFLPGLTGVFFIHMLNKKLAIKPATPYTEGTLVPAVITQVSPLKIAALANVSTGEDKTVWAVKITEIKHLPDTGLKPGTRVPCTALYDDIIPFSEIYSQVELYPLCWATGDKKTIENAINDIPTYEWENLKSLVPLALEESNRSQSKRCIYFDEDLYPENELNMI